MSKITEEEIKKILPLKGPSFSFGFGISFTFGTFGGVLSSPSLVVSCGADETLR